MIFLHEGLGEFSFYPWNKYLNTLYYEILKAGRNLLKGSMKSLLAENLCTMKWKNHFFLLIFAVQTDAAALFTLPFILETFRVDSV